MSLPYFMIPLLNHNLSQKEKEKKKAQTLLKLRAHVNKPAPVYPNDKWWKQFFEHSNWMGGAVPVEYRSWLEKFVLDHLPSDKQIIYTEPSGAYMFIPYGYKEWNWSSGIGGSTLDHVDKLALYKDMWKHGLIRSFKHDTYTTSVIWGGTHSIGDNYKDTKINLYDFTGINMAFHPAPYVKIYHFFQCAGRSTPPTHTILGWTKKGKRLVSLFKTWMCVGSFVL